ncbi:MAG: hypothetical protein KDD73_17520, partial [Anaerolineales bacterium]|nr:hypothetical protein [Anaerolineales bacterium]
MKRTIASLKTLLPRLAIAAFTLVCLVAFTYVLLALARGDGWTDALQRTAQETPRYFQRLATGDLGLTEAGSLTRAPVAVWPTVQEALPKSLVLLGASLFFAVLIGVQLGMITARWQNGP